MQPLKSDPRGLNFVKKYVDCLFLFVCFFKNYVVNGLAWGPKRFVIFGF